MKVLLCVLFLAAVANAQDDKYNVKIQYNKLIETIEHAEQKYNELPPRFRQLEYINAHVTLRLSDHLKKNFEDIRNKALKKLCNNTECFGSDAFKRGIAKVCLHTDVNVDREMNRFDSFINCSDSNLALVVNKIELVQKNLAVLRDSKNNLKKEYSDKENREEIVYVLEYHKAIVNRAKDVLLKSISELTSLYNILEQSLHECGKAGYPEVRQDFYEVTNVKKCLTDFLYKKYNITNEVITNTPPSSTTVSWAASNSTTNYTRPARVNYSSQKNSTTKNLERLIVTKKPPYRVGK